MDNIPDWWKILNIEDTEFERSKYAKSSVSGKGAFRIKDLNILRKILPDVYEAAAEEVKEFNTFHRLNGNTFDKVKLGRKLGSISLWDAALQPELFNDSKAQDKYWKDHPEFKAEQKQKHGPTNAK